MIAVPKPTPARKERKTPQPKVRAIPPKVKDEVFDRDGWTCQWCEVPGGALDAHHVTRRSQGGKDEVGNLISVHRNCHRYIHEHPSEAKQRGFLA
jgi:5-methylcytosine-specific restriction endonuclease McrA